jgi:mannose-1-phosphate guanylyltransferase
MTRQVRKAFVLGAGFGTRLRPLTNLLPKPLLPVFGKPLITFAFEHLLQVGIEQILVNTHHLPEKFAAYFSETEYRGASLEFVHEPVLLGTGGGLKNLEDRIGQEPLIVYSGDILTDVAVEHLIEEHFLKENDVTLALRTTNFAKVIHWDSNTGRVLDIKGSMGSGIEAELDFANISIWNATVFSRIPARTEISFVPILIEWMKSGGKIGGVALEEGGWFNIGSRKDYISAHKIIAAGRWLPKYMRARSWPLIVDPTARISPRSKIAGGSYIGAGSCVEEQVLLEDSILFPDSVVASGTTLNSCVVAGGKVGPGHFLETVFV